MLDGLEAVELRLSEVLEDNKLFRIEAEFFKKEYLSIEKKFNKAPLLSDNTKRIVCGPFGSAILDETYKESGVAVIRPFNIKNYQVEKDNIVYISENDVQEKNLKLFTKNTIFFSRVGDVKCGIFTENKQVTISPNIIAVEVDEEKYNPYFLTIFFNSIYGYLQILRELKIAAQPTISTERLRKLKLPTLSLTFQNKIGDIFLKVYKLKNESETLYKQAENLLLEELGLFGYEPSVQNVSVKSFTESFGESGRLDSEYYLPKYDELVEKIKSYRDGFKPIREVLTEDIKSGTTPKGILKKHIVNSNYFLRSEAFNNDLTLNYNSLYSMNDITFDKHKSIAVKKFDILVSMTGTIGSVAIVSKDINAIINQNIVKLSVNNELINYNIFALYMVTIGKILLTREQTGNVQPYVNIPNFSNLIVPILDKTIQTQIERKIKKSFILKEESKALLDLAKRAVEVAIEEGEDVAMG